MASLRSTPLRSGFEASAGSATFAATSGAQQTSSSRTTGHFTSRSNETVRSSTTQSQGTFASGDGGIADVTGVSFRSDNASFSAEAAAVDSETFSSVPWMKFQIVAIPQPDAVLQSQFLKGVVEEVKRKTTEEVVNVVQVELTREVERMIETLKSTVASKLETIDTIFTEQFKESIKTIKQTHTAPQALSLLPFGLTAAGTSA